MEGTGICIQKSTSLAARKSVEEVQRISKRQRKKTWTVKVKKYKSVSKNERCSCKDTPPCEVEGHFCVFEESLSSNKCAVFCIGPTPEEEMKQEEAVQTAVSAAVAVTVTAATTTVATTVIVSSTTSAAAAATSTTVATTTASSSSAGSAGAGGGAEIHSLGLDLSVLAGITAVHTPESVSGFADSVGKIAWGLFFVLPGTEEDSSAAEGGNGTRRFLSNYENDIEAGDQELEAFVKLGMYKYCSDLNIDPMYLMVNVLFAGTGILILILGFSFSTKVLLRMHEKDKKREKPRFKCLKRIFPPQVEQYLKSKFTPLNVLVKVSYALFYPLLVSCLFQIQYFMELSAYSQRAPQARLLATVASILVAMLISWAAMLMWCARHELTIEDDKNRKLTEKVRFLFNPATKSLSGNFREGRELFWCFRMVYVGANAFFITMLFNPNPIQASTLLLWAFSFLILTMYLSPYTSRAANIGTYCYMGLNVFNMGIFVVYSLERDVLSSEGYATLGKIQVFTNLGTVFLILFVEMAKRFSVLKKLFRAAKKETVRRFTKSKSTETANEGDDHDRISSDRRDSDEDDAVMPCGEGTREAELADEHALAL